MMSKGTHMSYLLPRPHLRAADLLSDGGKLPVTIKRFGRVTAYDRKVQDEVQKGALFFQEDERYLIVNETQLEQIAKILGTEILEDWIGKKIVLVHEKVKVGKQMKDAIRIQAFIGHPAPNGSAQAQPVAEQPGDPGVVWHDSGEERWKPGLVRTKAELWELCKVLGIDGEQAKALVAELGGDLSAAYDKVLRQYADLILRMGTKQTGGNDG